LVELLTQSLPKVKILNTTAKWLAVNSKSLRAPTCLVNEWQ